MSKHHVRTGLAAGLLLLAGCAQPATPAPAPGETQPASSAPATSAAGAGTDAKDLIGRMAAAQAGVRTYAIEMSMDTAVMGQATSMVMSGRIDQSDPAEVRMAMDMEFAGMKMKLLQLGQEEMYLQMDAAGDTWMRVPPDQMGQYQSTTDSTDLSAKLREMEGSIKSVEAVGQETVEGTPTTHYRITIDAAAVEQLTGAEGGVKADDFTYEIWLDEESLARKVQVDLKVELDGKPMPFRIDGTMGDYNEPVEIKAPPKDKITDLPG